MKNPIGFRPGPVSFWTSVVYIGLLVPLIIINESVPRLPSTGPSEDFNVTEAWLDLATLTNAYHPYNSRRNDEVRDWLLLRIQQILDDTGASWSTEVTDGNSARPAAALPKSQKPGRDVVVFNDMTANFSAPLDRTSLGTGGPSKSSGAQASYFEGTNILVYIRGTDDEDGDWWAESRVGAARDFRKGGTLVNAHYDSVSTGYGATDDGMGVVSVLQLIRHFTSSGRRPKRGIVALLNNGEEDYLYGARALGQSPLLPFIHTFLNLEGAGAGGRAILFRTTDQEVTAAYAKTEHPFGTVIGSDSFSLGLIRSQTDYVVLNGVYGQRGLDVAFYKPRARYHTNQDDLKHASKASLWHMMHAALTTMINLSDDTGDTFVGRRPDHDQSRVSNGSPSDGVWFDVFGKGFVLFNLRGMFAWTLTILIASPLILLLITYLLAKADKYYFFSIKVRTYENSDFENVSVGGLKGFFRFPLALGFAGAITLGAAFLLRKVNPFIIYSSQYSVWAMMVSIFYFAFWLIVRGASVVRPSALHRGYAHIWLFILGWIVLVGVAVLEDRFRISAGYFVVFFQSAIFLSTLITLLELFGLPKMSAWGRQVREEHEAAEHMQAIPNSSALISPTPGELFSPAIRDEDEDDEPEPANETTPLVGGNTRDNIRTTFATTYRRSVSAIMDGARKVKEGKHKPYADEQDWSGNLPSWVWIFQFLIGGAFSIILAGQIGLTLVDAVNQTGVDGSSLLLPYLIISIFSIVLLLPMTPYMHRVTHHIPVFLLAVFVGTLVYNLVAFPFSPDSRYKAFFQQMIDLDTGTTTNHFHGIEPYIRSIISELPSAAGKAISCERSTKNGTVDCYYDGSLVPPRLSGANATLPDGIPPQHGYADLININATRGAGRTARLEVNAANTKACFLHFDRPVSRFDVVGGSGWDERFGAYPAQGIGLLKLWRRDWNKTWVVDVEWPAQNDEDSDGKEETTSQQGLALHDADISGGELKSRDASGLDGYVACQWSDANVRGTIPALDEALQFAPAWAGITKFAEGLVEGKKTFMV